jgi:hypothetical protein
MILNTIEEHPDFYERDKHSLWIFKLSEEYKRQTSFVGKKFVSKWLRIDEDGTITVPKEYAWNGATPKWSILDLFVLGTPDGIIDIHTMKPRVYYPSLVHDSLYQYLKWHQISRAEADKLLLDMLGETDFFLRYLYYWVVRALGGIVAPKKHPDVADWIFY